MANKKRLTKKESLIKKIKIIVEEWGSFSINEVEHESSPILSKKGKDTEWLVERVSSNDVNAIKYVHGQDVADDDIPFEDLTIDLLEEILRIAENYEVDMIKTEKRCQD